MEGMEDIGGMCGMRDTSLWCMGDMRGMRVMGGMIVKGGMGGREVRAVGRERRF